MIVSLIVAMSKNRVIGRDGKLPWRVAEDTAWFRQHTLGKPIIMGRVTFDSLPNVLPGRTNIIVSRTMHPVDDVMVARSLNEALIGLEANGIEEVVVIGGASIYEQVISCVDRMYLTTVMGNYLGDAYFPNFDMREWHAKKVSATTLSHTQYACSFEILERKREVTPCKSLDGL